MKNSKITAFLFATLAFSLNIGCTQESASSQPEENTQAAVITTAPETEAVNDAATEATTEAATESKELDLSKLSTFELSSEDLHDGVWDEDITNTLNGSNRSPQLSWEPVDGAGCYAIFMIDTTSVNWLHWKSVTESETKLPAGWAPESEYIGPYPPKGYTHAYEIFVLALREQPEKIKGKFDDTNPKMLEYAKEIDGENEDNIISYGHLTGTYTKPE